MSEIGVNNGESVGIGVGSVGNWVGRSVGSAEMAFTIGS